MKASELRIGNWVNHQEHKCVRVTDIDSKNIGYDWHDGDRSGWYDIDDFKPIQLTDEWLLKFGFDVGNYKNYYSNDNLICELHFDDFNNEFDCVIDRYSITTIKYVHELQNLYFALTNEEL